MGRYIFHPVVHCLNIYPLLFYIHVLYTQQILSHRWVDIMWLYKMPRGLLVSELRGGEREGGGREGGGEIERAVLIIL
jgi:hypothetical protein